MCTTWLTRSAAFVLASASLAPLGMTAQTFAATTGTDAVITAIPEPSAAKITVPGHRRHAEEKLLYGRVRDGVYTVDGMVAKVKLNYDVNGVDFLYMFVPGVGTAVVSAVSDPHAVVNEATLKENELSFKVGEHRFDLTGVALASDKGSAPAHLYVRLDREAWQLNRHPMLGFGNVAALPYQWPGALAESAPRTEESEVIPAVPVTLLPSQKAVVPRVSSPVAADPAALPPVSTP